MNINCVVVFLNFNSMGNSVVIPSFQDWYSQPLKKIGYNIKSHLDSGTFFMVFDGFRQNQENEEFIVKAYEYNDSLASLPRFKYWQEYFQNYEQKKEGVNGVQHYDYTVISGSSAFLIRKKFDRSLVDFLTIQIPSLTHTEKLWIIYQIGYSINTLNSIGLYHGDLKPSNIFVHPSLETVIVDLAPFKPMLVNPNKMHLYYHFFSTSNNSGFYLAPERISVDNNSDIDLQVADFFSIGCLMYFLFTDGEHLFDTTSAIKYSQGKFDLTEKLSKISDEKVRYSIQNLVQLDPNERKQFFASLYDNTSNILFPIGFKLFLDLFRSYRISNSFQTSIDVPRLVSIAITEDIETRIIALDFICDKILLCDNLGDLLCLLPHFSSFSNGFSDSIKLERSLPCVVSILYIDNPVLLLSSLQFIIDILSSVESIPAKFSGIFELYLQRPLTNVWQRNDPRSMLILADFLPKYAVELKRLSPMALLSFSTAFSLVFTTDNISTFRVFARSMKAVAHAGGSLVLSSLFFVLLTSFNHPGEEFKTEIIRILYKYYSIGNRHDNKIYFEQCQDSVIPICIDISSRSPSTQLLTEMLEFLCLIFARRIIHQRDSYEIIMILRKYYYYPDPSIRYHLNKLFIMLPIDTKDSTLYSFAFEPPISITPSSKKAKEHHTAQEKINPSCNNLLSPKFLSSLKCSSQKVSLLLPLPSNRFAAIVGSKRIKFYVLPNQSNSYPNETLSKMVKEPISSASSSDNSLFIGYRSGLLEGMDLNVHRNTKIINFEEEILSISAGAKNTLLCLSQSDIKIVDPRMKQIVNSITYKDYHIKTHCLWPNTDFSIGVGFAEGALSLIDMRMLMPIWFNTTPPIKNLIPMKSEFNSTINYMATYNEGANIYEEPSHSIVKEINANNVFGIPFEGGAILLDNWSASYIQEQGNIVQRLFDRRTEHIHLNKNQKQYHPFRYSNGQSIHKHNGSITSVINISNSIVSGDSDGFINTWCI